MFEKGGRYQGNIQNSKLSKRHGKNKIRLKDRQIKHSKNKKESEQYLVIN